MSSGWGTGAALVLAVSFLSPAWAGGPRVTARAAIVVDAASGATLWERSADTPLPPASTTKVLTAILALESGRLDEELPVSEYAASTAPSKLGLRPGQRMQLRDLLYAVLLKSANDASTVVAEGLGGSEVRFAARMTSRAHALGAVSSNFENAHGLTAPGHVSTARDLARLFRHGLGLPGFRDVLETPSVAVPVYGSTVQTVSVRSHNRLLTGWTRQVIGKTGYTRPAKRCFVGAATDGQREVIIALLGSTDMWGDAKRLVAFGLGEEIEEPAPAVVAAAVPKPKPSRTAAVAAAAAAKSRTIAKRKGAGRAVIEGDRDEEPAAPRRWIVQLGPYGNRTTLRTTRIALARRGYRSDVVGSAIRVGSFPTKQGAERLAGKLRGSGYRPGIVAQR